MLITKNTENNIKYTIQEPDVLLLSLDKIMVIDCVTTAFASVYFNTIGIKHRFIIVKIDYFSSYFALLIIH